MDTSQYEVLYCNGVGKSGNHYAVELPFTHLPRTGWKTAVVDYAKHQRISAKKSGILDALAVAAAE